MEEGFAGLDGKLAVRSREESRTTAFSSWEGGGDTGKTRATWGENPEFSL